MTTTTTTTGTIDRACWCRHGKLFATASAAVGALLTVLAGCTAGQDSGPDLGTGIVMTPAPATDLPPDDQGSSSTHAGPDAGTSGGDPVGTTSPDGPDSPSTAPCPDPAVEPRTPTSGPASSAGGPGGRTAEPLSAAQAQQIALADAGLTSEDVTFLGVELDHDAVGATYEVEFLHDSTEYEYEIDAATGAVLSADRDIENFDVHD